jgi:hypothetical protein
MSILDVIMSRPDAPRSREMSLVGIVEGVVGNAIWSGTTEAFRRVAGRQIQITFPRPGELLEKPEPVGSGRSYEVRGKLKRLRQDHNIWVLREDERSGRVWPQGFFPVQFFSDKGEWVGIVIGVAGNPVKIVAVVAPPSSCDLFSPGTLPSLVRRNGR